LLEKLLLCCFHFVTQTFETSQTMYFLAIWPGRRGQSAEFYEEHRRQGLTRKYH